LQTALLFLFLLAVLVRPKLAIFPFVAAYILFGVAREVMAAWGESRRAVKERDNGEEK
jgi:hypothetical protein